MAVAEPPGVKRASQLDEVTWKRAKRHTALFHEAGYFLLGLVSLATVTGLYFWLDVPLVAAAFTYLVVLVLLSLVSNLSFLIVLSLICVCCLNYFFVPPIYSFRVDYPQDLITLSAFVITSIVVNFLVTRVRDANQRLEVANKAVRIEDVERKRAEQSLRESEAALRESERSSRSALDGIPGLVAILAPNGELETVNRQCLEYFGRSLEELKNWGTNDSIHPEDLPRVLELFKRAMASGIPFNFELRLRRFDGEYRWFDNRHVPIRDDSGRIARWYLLATDIEDRKRAEAALRDSEEALRRREKELRDILETIPAMTVTVLPDGSDVFIGKRYVEYSGLSADKARRSGWKATVHPDDLDRHVSKWRASLASGEPIEIETRFRRADGEYRWFLARAVPQRDDRGNILKWYEVLTDIEDRTRALAQLEQMQSDFAHMNRVSMMGELAASLSHEITQPIASARNNARAAQNFLDMQQPDLGEVREALGCVVGDTDRAGDIVNRMREHMKKAPPRKAQFDLNEAIDEVIVLGRCAIIKNRVWVQTRLSEGLLLIHGDRVQLQQVVLNLLLNAVEAMGSVEGASRELLVSTEQDHTGVLVAVRDSGPGLDPSHRERVFDAFYTTKSSGMGMGLSICRSIIDAHGGRLWAEANEPRGTIFQFTLPAVP